MLVEEIMCKNIVSLTPEDTIQTAKETMEKHNVRHIPIVSNNKLVGIISERDIKRTLPSNLLNEREESVNLKSLYQIMTSEVYTAHPLDFIEDAAKIIQEYKIGCLPIVSKDKIVGIVTASDIIETFLLLTGASQPSTQIEVETINSNENIMKILHTITSQKATLLSFVIYPKKENDTCIFTFRIKTINSLSLIELLKKEGFAVLCPTM